MIFGQHQVCSRHWTTASTTWISHPKGANSGVAFGGMAHSESPSLHAILKESPNEDDSALSDGESFDSPLLRVYNTMIPVTPSQLPEETPTFLTAWMTPQRTTTPTPLPEQLAAHPEERWHTHRMTSSEETRSIETSSLASGLPWRPG
jgi:hypothetical protein